MGGLTAAASETSLELSFMMPIVRRYLKPLLPLFAYDDLYRAAVGRMGPHRFIEQVRLMTKTIAPVERLSTADRVTYAVVGLIVIGGILAFIFLQ
ncbi:MAG TPA: hypothetical protein VGF53_01050 [Pseudolabrys sp.]